MWNSPIEIVVFWECGCATLPSCVTDFRSRAVPWLVMWTTASHGGSATNGFMKYEPFGPKFGTRGDRVGCLYDGRVGTVSFTLNGTLVRHRV